MNHHAANATGARSAISHSAASRFPVQNDSCHQRLLMGMKMRAKSSCSRDNGHHNITPSGGAVSSPRASSSGWVIHARHATRKVRHRVDASGRRKAAAATPAHTAAPMLCVSMLCRPMSRSRSGAMPNAATQRLRVRNVDDGARPETAHPTVNAPRACPMGEGIVSATRVSSGGEYVLPHHVQCRGRGERAHHRAVARKQEASNVGAV